jgi:hypothetical protein
MSKQQNRKPPEIEEGQLDEQIAKLGFVRNKIPKDGACLFRAVSEAVFGSQIFHRFTSYRSRAAWQASFSHFL